MKIVFAGSPEYAAIALKALLDAGPDLGFSVVGAYTQPDRPAGRGVPLTSSAVKQLALSRGIPVFQPPTFNTPEAQAELAALDADVMVVAAYGLILPQAVLDIPHKVMGCGCLNIHASLLPRWRGAAPVHRAILAGDTKTGISIVQMEAKFDTGPVMLATHVSIDSRETAGQLYERLGRLGASAMVHVITRLVRGYYVVASAQPSDNLTYAHKISREEIKIDWRVSALEIDRKIRAFNPSPGAWTTWRGDRLVIWAANPAADQAPKHGIAPGTVIADDRGRLLIACASSILEITELQSADAPRMQASAWLAGGGAAARADDRFGAINGNDAAA